MLGGGWNASWIPIPGETCDEPALAILGNYLHLVVRGMDDGIYHKLMDLSSGVWSDWLKLPGSTKSAPTLIRSTSESLALVVRGLDDGIYYNSWEKVWIPFPQPGFWIYMWTGWTPIPGSTVDRPALASDGSTMILAVRGSNNGIYVKTMDLGSGVWYGWEKFSGGTYSPPAVETAPYVDDFVLFVRGMNNKIYYTHTEHGVWGPWDTVPMGSTKDRLALARTSYYDELLHLVVRGMDDGVYHNIMDFGTLDWDGWEKVPGTTKSCPGLTDYYYVGLDLVFHDGSSRIWYNYWNGVSGWSHKD
jgi:hypothetical protein